MIHAVATNNALFIQYTPSNSLGNSPLWNCDITVTASFEKDDHLIMLWKLRISESSPWGRIVKEEGPININKYSEKWEIRVWISTGLIKEYEF